MDMDEREEGEISGDAEDDELGAYNPVVRPIVPQYRQTRAQVPSSDEEYLSDSDSDSPDLPKRRKPDCSQMEVTTFEKTAPLEKMQHATDNLMQAQNHKSFRKNNIWANVLGEQVLEEEIGGVGLRRCQGDRNVENYNFKVAAKLYRLEQGLPAEEGEVDDDEEEEEEEEEEEQEEEESQISKSPERPDESTFSRKSRKRSAKERLGPRINNGPVKLADLKVNPDWTDEELGCAIADALLEEKPHIIVRVVQVLGKERALELYKQTQEIESDGGILTADGSRRRTAGGVYLQIVKKIPTLNKEQLRRIFPPEDSRSWQQWRRRKRAARRRNRHEPKPQGAGPPADDEESYNQGCVLSDDPGGSKCPGSTPVTSPQASDNENNQESPKPAKNPLQEEAAMTKDVHEMNRRDLLADSSDSIFGSLANQDEMDVF